MSDLVERLRAMPSSYNDACRAMDKAADRIEQLEAALRGVIQTLESLNDTKRASFYRGSVVNELTMALDLARAAVAEGQDK